MKHSVGGVCLAVALSLAVNACGSGRPDQASTAPAGPGEAVFLAGVHASDIAKTMGDRGLSCGEPKEEQGYKHWVCEVKTPLLTYMTEDYGKAPGRIEYIRAVVSQTGAPKIDLITPVLGAVANLRYSDVDRAAARAWVEQSVQTGGETRIGQAKFKLSGDLSRLILEVKAPGSEW